MDLKDFVAETLKQIIEGVKEAQTSEGGDLVNAKYPGESSGNFLNAGNYGTFTRVDFDVAISAEASGKGGANLKVWSVGFEGAGEKKSSFANRVNFSVPIRLPDGDQKRAQEIEKRQAENMGKLAAGLRGRTAI